MHNQGEVALIVAFWKQVHEDLTLDENLWARRYPARTVKWVVDREPGYLTWCALCGADPEEAEVALRKQHKEAFARYA